MIQKKTLDTRKHLSKLPLYYNGGEALPPQHDDLERLYSAIVSTRSLTVLEFGCGYSTFVISEALEENKAWFDNLRDKPLIRNQNAFQCFSVDTNEQWIEQCSDKLLNASAKIFYSECNVVQLNGQVCHTYSSIPNVVPDFIYLDGPDPQQVKGNINGISWGCAERTPMSADILLMEPTLIPGTMILVDGRVNNVRFLQSNLKRNWDVHEYEDIDQTIFYLNEPRLGKVNVVGRDICQ